MIVLDTNMLSALIHPSPDALAVAWFDRQPRATVWITAITVFEIRTGIELLPHGRRRLRLEESFVRLLSVALEGRVLPFDVAAAQAAGERGARRQQSGFTDDPRDTQIAGIVLARQATLATRNTRDFPDLGARVINPWQPI